MQDIIVIYHGKCTDGFGAAYAAWKKFGSTATYLPMSHGDSVPDVTNKVVYILDFSFKKEIYLKLLTIAKDVILLDHHKTALDNLQDAPGCFFDLSRSGAMISWNYFHPTIPAPKFIEYIQDGDLFQFKLDNTRFFYRGIHSTPHDFDIWTQFEDAAHLDKIIQNGKIIEVFFQSQVQDMTRTAIPVELFGEKGLMVNSTWMFASELGNILAIESGTYALIWYQSEKDIKCSLRSIKGYDCSLIAQKMNGGGHPQASAFTVPELHAFLKLIGK